MFRIIILLLIPAVGITSLTSCSTNSEKTASKNSEDEYAHVKVGEREVSMKVTRNARGEVLVDDADLEKMKRRIKTSGINGEGNTRNTKDNSQTNVMFDGYGNKVEIRRFYNDNRLKQVVVRTQADGSRKVFVYGTNGSVKSVPTELENRILDASANEISDAAMIYEPVIRRQTQSSDTAGKNDDQYTPGVKTKLPDETTERDVPIAVKKDSKSNSGGNANSHESPAKSKQTKTKRSSESEILEKAVE